MKPYYGQAPLKIDGRAKSTFLANLYQTHCICGFTHYTEAFQTSRDLQVQNDLTEVTTHLIEIANSISCNSSNLNVISSEKRGRKKKKCGYRQGKS